jgi:hypothetical protein
MLPTATLFVPSSLVEHSKNCLTLEYDTNRLSRNVGHNILIHIQQDATLHSLFYLATALHISGGTTTHHQERFECALGGVRHPEHTQTGSNSSTMAAGNSNGVTTTRC